MLESFKSLDAGTQRFLIGYAVALLVLFALAAWSSWMLARHKIRKIESKRPEVFAE